MERDRLVPTSAGACADADVTIVIPTFNECDCIDLLLARLFAVCDREGVKVDVIIVDDNSADGTGMAAEEWAMRRPVRVIHRPGKLGLGTAVMDGVSFARTEVVGVMDADLSHPPEIIPKLLREMVRRDLDLVVASRYVPGGGTDDFPMSRWLLSCAGCVLARPLTPVRDAMSGYFLIKRSALADFDSVVSGFKIGLEMFVRARHRSFGEVGYVFVGRRAGASKMSLAEATGFLRQLIRLSRDTMASGSVLSWAFPARRRR
jgi:dolichol-phosphate mannosyltransferase